jgi:hypothetical protein
MLFCGCNVCLGRRSIDKEEVLHNYKNAIPQLKYYYSHISGSGSATLSRRIRSGVSKFPKREDILEEKTRIISNKSFKMNGDWKLIKIQYIETEHDTNGNRTRVISSNDEYDFILDYPSKSNPILKSVEKPHALDNTFSSGLEFVRAVYEIGYIDATLLLNDASFRISDLKEIDYHGRRCLKFSFTCSIENIPFKSGWFIVSPSDKWVILRSACDIYIKNQNAIWNQGYDMLVNYEFRDGDFPIIKSVDDLMFLRRNITKLDHFEHLEVPLSEFKLTSFGLPEIGVKAESINRYGPLVSFFIIGAILVLVGFTVFYLARKSNRAGKTV